MSRITTAAVAVAAVLATTPLLTACGSSSNSGPGPLENYKPTVSQGVDTSKWSDYTFTIGDNGGDGSEELAAITGVFKNAKYKVKFAHFTYGPPLVQAAASGDISLGSVGDVPPITGAAKEFGFSVVGVSRSLAPTEPQEDIIVPAGSPITSLKDLKGKKIAVPQGSSAHGLALLALKSVGLTPKDVQLVFLPPADAATAFQAGKVDAWSIWNPQAALAVKAGAKIIAKGLPPIDQTSAYYVASNKDLDDPDRKAALADVFERLSAEFTWANANPNPFAQAVSKEEGIPVADALAVLDTFKHRVTPVTAVDIKAEQDLATAFLEANQITKKVNVVDVVRNILPANFDSAHLPVK